MTLERFLDDAVEEPARRSIEAHLSGCPRCRDSLTQIGENLRMLAPLKTLYARGADDDGVRERPPRSIAGFRIIRRIGRGGMGVVFEAEQLHPRRIVALKIIRGADGADPSELKSFQREARALARLQHPAIAAIHHSGITEDGEHFFAMEFVRGLPLLEYVRVQKLGERPRLVLFHGLCAAIHYAHQRGVIHLDIKPANILIAPDGHPKILDFGLARICDGDGAAASAHSRNGKFEGTLPYMSPEQVRGRFDDVDVRSDVFALGVLIYQLTTNRLPHEPESRTWQQLADAICTQSPRRPRELVPAIASDVETIILKSLEREPDRRYQSALALAEDVDRFLVNQPIQARPPSAAYHLRKLVSRHRMVFALVASIFLLVLGFAGAMGALYARARGAERLAGAHLVDMQSARDDARVQADHHLREAEKAKRVTHYLRSMFSSMEPYATLRGNVTVRQMLDEAVLRVESDLTLYPEIQAELRSTLGETYMTLGLFAEAEEQLNAAMRTRLQLWGDAHPAAADAHRALGRLGVATYQFDLATDHFRRALDIRRGLHGEDHVDVATAEVDLAGALRGQGDTDGAAALTRTALIKLRSLLGDRHPAVAASLLQLAEAEYFSGDFESAAVLARQALGILRPHQPERPLEVIRTLDLLGWTMSARGEYAAAETIFREALDISRRHLGDRHPVVAVELYNIAHRRFDLGYIDEAEALFHESLDIKRDYFLIDCMRVVDGLSGVAGMRWARGDYEAAETSFREILDKTRSLLGDNHPFVAGPLNSLAVVLRDREQFDEAVSLFERSLEMTERYFGPRHLNSGNVLNNLARLHLLKGDLPAAEPLIRRALDIRRASLPAGHPDIAESQMVLGVLFARQGLHAQARAELDAALQSRLSAFSDDHWLVAEARCALAEPLIGLRRFSDAESLLSDSLAVFQRRLDGGHKLIRQTLERFVTLYERSGHAELAAEYRTQLDALHAG